MLLDFNLKNHTEKTKDREDLRTEDRRRRTEDGRRILLRYQNCHPDEGQDLPMGDPETSSG
jgi:hypothetical protein